MAQAAGFNNAIDTAVWLDQMRRLGTDHGTFETIGTRHYAMTLSGDSTLLVTFERAGDARSRPSGRPMGWDAADDAGWSHLCLMSEGQSWFRSQSICTFIDDKIDEGFFDEFERVVFYGAGPCGYAAAAYSVASPGAKVVLVAPQATLDPEITGWDLRFVKHRRSNFTNRYGYAPDMLQAAGQAYIIYDPAVHLDAIHAALFTAPNVEKLPTRYLGADIVTALNDLGILPELLDAACEGHLSRKVFYQLFRARRNNQRYLTRLVDRLVQSKRLPLAASVCRYASKRFSSEKFTNRLQRIERQLSKG